MSVDPFSHTTTRNVLDHILVPTIVGSTAGYEVKLNMTNLNTVYSSQIGDTSNRVNDIWVNTLHWNTLDPVINSGGTAGSGGTGATGTAGVTGPTGPAGPTGKDGAGVTQVNGSTGQVLYYTGNGITSQSNFSILNGTLALPPISSDLELMNTSTLLFSTQTDSSQIESGQINAVGSGNSLIISDVGYTNNTATFDTVNSRVGIRTENPETELDVNGQATITFDGITASTSFTVILDTTVGSTGQTGITLAALTTYNIYGWGQGGYNNGGQGGAGGYLKANVFSQTPTFLSWNSLLGGTDMNTNPSGGNALQIFVGGTLSALVPGGGGGITGAVGAGVGLAYGNPLPQSGYSAGTTGGTGGYVQTPPGAIVTIQGGATASISNVNGTGYIDYGATGTVPAGTIITYSPTTTLDASRGNGQLLFLGPGGMSNQPPVITIAGSTGITFFNTSYTTSASGSTLTTSGPISVGITGISLVSSVNTASVDLNLQTGVATTTGPVTGFAAQQTINGDTIVLLPANVVSFVPPPILSGGRQQFSITSGNVADYLIDTSARTVTFSTQSIMTFGCRIITSDVAVSGSASITGFTFPVQRINRYADNGSQFVGATGSGGGGGGAGYYGGGGGATGGGGGAGSGFISGLTGQFLNGSNVAARLSKFNTLSTKHGWAAPVPNLPRIVIEQYIAGPQQPALVVNGGVIAGSSGSTFTNLTVNGQTEITGTLQIDGVTSGTQQSALVVNGAADIDSISISNASLSNGVIQYNLSAPGGTNQLLGNILCNSVTTTGDISAGGDIYVGNNFQLYQEEAGSIGGVTGHRTVIQQRTVDPVNQGPNIMLLRPTSGPPQGLSITHQTGMTYTNNCLVSVDGDLSVTGSAQINGSLYVNGPVIASNIPMPVLLLTGSSYTFPQVTSSLPFLYVNVKVWGGGGSGQGSGGNPGGGGGSGDFIEKTVHAFPGQGITYTIGAGGINDGGPAGNTSITIGTTVITANGGAGGSIPGGGAAGGTGGSPGTSAITIGVNGLGGNGGGIGGGVGASTLAGTNGQNGAFFGAGGGGGVQGLAPGRGYQGAILLTITTFPI